MHPQASGAAPAPLKVAASVAALEAVAVLGVAVAELLSTSGDRLLLGLTTTLFFLLYGGLLLASSWLVTRGVSWTRGPVLMAQLFQLVLAWTLREEGTRAIAVALVVASAVVLAGMLHPQSVGFLLDDPEAADGPEDRAV